MKPVRFPSGDDFCVADLYLPEGMANGEKRAAIIMGQGFTGLKAMLAEEAVRLAAAGFVVLAIEYRGFGESGGEPRSHVIPRNQVDDFRNAICWLEQQPFVDSDRIGLWGTSFGGGVVIYAAALDKRIKAVVAQMPIVDGWRWMQALRTTEQWEALCDRLIEARRERCRTGAHHYVPAVASFKSGEFCAMPADDEITGFAQASMEAFPGRRGDVTIETIDHILDWRPIDVIQRVAPRPLMIVAASGYDINHPLEHVMEAFHKAREPKAISFVPCGQMDLYMEPQIDVGMAHAISWFESHLGKQGGAQ